MKKVSLFFNFDSYKTYSKYLNLLFEEHPELKTESKFYKSLQEHNKSINGLVSYYEKVDSKDEEQFYLFCFLPSLTIISTRNKESFLKILSFIRKYHLESNSLIKGSSQGSTMTLSLKGLFN